MLELDDFQLRIDSFQIEQVGNLGPAPTVDALIVIAHHAEIAMSGRQEIDQLELRCVRILIFIDHDITIALPAGFEHFGMLFKELQDEQNQVVKINRVAGAQGRLVLLLDMLGKGEQRGRLVSEALRTVVLEFTQETLDHFHVEFFVAGENMAHDLAQSRDLVRFIVNNEIILIAQAVDKEPQDTDAEGVEGRDRRFRGFLTLFTRCSFGDKLRDALLHFPCGLIGKGDGQNLLRRHSAFNKVRHPGSNDTSFARAGSGQNHDRAFQSGDSFELLRVEGIEVYHKIKGHRTDSFSQNRSSEKRFSDGVVASGVDLSGLRGGSAGGKSLQVDLQKLGFDGLADGLEPGLLRQVQTDRSGPQEDDIGRFLGSGFNGFLSGVKVTEAGEAFPERLFDILGVNG